jgi:hypothetical protein
MFDVKEVEKQARQEIAAEQADSAKKQIIAKLREIAKIERMLDNAKLEYDALLRDIGHTV